MDATRRKELKDYAGPDRVVPSTELWEQIRHNAPAKRFHLGLPRLDEVVGGVEEGELIVMTGPTAMGKTLLCSTIMKAMSAEGHRPMMLTYEVSVNRFAEDHRTADSMIYLPMVHQAGSYRWLEDRCWEAAEKFVDLSAIFIDHLQYLHEQREFARSTSLDLGLTVRDLKRLALALELPIFLVAHMTKIPLDQEPSMHHLRDSGLIACEADTVLVVYRQMDVGPDGDPLKTMQQGRAIIKADKCRRTGHMGKRIEVYKDGNKLRELVEAETV